MSTLYIASASTLSAVADLQEQITRVRGGLFVPIVLVGNKCDLEKERAVTREDGERLAVMWGCSLYETSAKTGHNIKEVFEKIIQSMNPTEDKSSCCTCL